MTRQEMYEQVARHLFAQKKPSFKRMSFQNKTVCMYRGPDDCRCALGIFLDDNSYIPAMEGKCVRYLIEKPTFSKRLPPTFNEENADFLMDLQRCHDATGNWRDDRTMKLALLSVADVYNLDASFLDTLTFGDDRCPD